MNDVKADNAETYASDAERLGGLLGAFAAEIGPADPQLADLLTVWPVLPAEARASILAAVREGQAKPAGKPAEGVAKPAEGGQAK